MVSEDPQKLTADLEGLTNDLRLIVENMKLYSNALEFLASQMSAVFKLQKDESKPLFISLSTSRLNDLISQIAKAYKEEIKVSL